MYVVSILEKKGKEEGKRAAWLLVVAVCLLEYLYYYLSKFTRYGSRDDFRFFFLFSFFFVPFFSLFSPFFLSTI